MKGESAALMTAILWTITAISFEYAGKRIGSRILNFLRLLFGAFFLGIYGLIVHGNPVPFDASLSAWLWLGASGLVGLAFGDLLLFQSFIDLGARLTMLIYALVPACAAVLGWFALGERLSGKAIGGMCLTLAGIAIAVLGRPAPANEAAQGNTSDSAKRRARGIIFAFAATFCQAAGLIMSKIGAPSLDAFSGTQIRVIIGALAFGIILAITRSGGGIMESLRNRKALVSLVGGSFFGPFLGVSLSLAAIQGASAGVASSIMSITPVLIILPSVAIFHERVTLLETIGAFVAVGGTALLFL